MDPDLQELLESISSDSPPSDEELNAALEDLSGLLDEATGDTPDLEAARSVRAAIDQINAELTTRSETREAEAAEAATLREGVLDQEEAEEGPEGEEDLEPVEEADSEAVAASLRDAQRRLRARVDARALPELDANPHVRVRALGQAAGDERLTVTSTMADVARIFSDHAPAVTEGRQRLVRSELVYPDERVLGAKLEDNMRLIDAVAAPQAIAAAGGICDPLPADFNHVLIGDRGRPIKNALPSFNAARGGVRYMPAVSLSDFTGGITVWTEENDQSPSDPAEKACLVIDCDTELLAKVDAVVACAQIGNFQARFNPEQWRRALEGLALAHDRTAEQTLYAQLAGDATAVTYAGGRGTVYNVLSALDKAAAGYRSRLRITSTRLRTIGPEWFRNALRADIASQRLGSSPAEALTVADAIIDSFFAVRGIDPIWSPDLDVFGAQGAGALLDFPGADVDLLLYAEGDFLFLDGGTLDLGTEITDSVLNKTNDRQAFMETFEKAILRGVTGAPLLLDGLVVGEVCICPEVLEVTS